MTKVFHVSGNNEMVRSCCSCILVGHPHSCAWLIPGMCAWFVDVWSCHPPHHQSDDEVTDWNARVTNDTTI